MHKLCYGFSVSTELAFTGRFLYLTGFTVPVNANESEQNGHSGGDAGTKVPLRVRTDSLPNTTFKIGIEQTGEHRSPVFF